MRKICVITGSRADASPLSPLIKALNLRDDCEISLIETHGLYGHESSVRVQLGYVNPDIVVLLGDRYETLIAATVACLLNIPIAHLCGGDVTLGAVDDYFRHAITKLAYWHLPMCSRHAARITQMGEAHERIYALGSPGVDLLANKVLSKNEIETALGVKLVPPVTLICYHPETLLNPSNRRHIIPQEIIQPALYPHKGTCIISGANADFGGEEINSVWEAVHCPSMNVVFRPSYPQLLWISLMGYADTLLGNSSGFIVEGMTLKSMQPGKPEIKIIGHRQNGRYEDAVTMFEKEKYPFGVPGHVSAGIAEVLATIEIPETTQKAFHDR